MKQAEINVIRKEKIDSFLQSCNQFIFCLFIFFAPFSYSNFGIGSSVDSFPIDIFICAFGSIFCFSSVIFFHKELIDKNIKNIAVSFAVFTIISFLVALSQYSTFNGWFGTNPIFTCAKISFYVFRFICELIYCYFSFQIVKKESIYYSFISSLVFIVLVGLLQLGSMKGINAASLILDFLAKSRIIQGSAYVRGINRLALTASEPAHTAVIVFAYFSPMAIIVFKRSTKKSQKITIAALISLLLILELFTYSAEVLLTSLFFVLLLLIALFIFLIKNKKWIEMSLILLGFIACIALLVQVPKIQQVLIEKIVFSDTNYSGARRMAVCYFELMTFLTHPFFGVGPGCAGYYNFQFVINKWFMISKETRNDLLGLLGLNTGGPSVFWFLASYGIIGCFFLAKPFVRIENSFFASVERREKILLCFSLLTYFFLSLISLNITIDSTFPLVLFSSIVISNAGKKMQRINVFCDF